MLQYYKTNINMDYKSTDINFLQEEMKNRIVTFEYKKKDGSIRTAKGTMNEDELPERLPEKISLEKDVIDELMKAKNIQSLDDYAKENGLKYWGTETDEFKSYYVFNPIKTERKVNENQILYYDIEKDAFRSFLKDNFLGIIE